jgi:hypothetical protein
MFMGCPKETDTGTTEQALVRRPSEIQCSTSLRKTIRDSRSDKISNQSACRPEWLVFNIDPHW